MEPDVAIFAIFAVAAVFAIIQWFARQRRPKQKSFRCGRCSSPTLHTERTIEAWQRGKTKFFCDSCHREWIRSHPREPASSPRGGRAGCLGALVLLVSIPAIALIFRAFE